MIGKPSELDGSTTRFCPGKAGLSVLISEDDLRETVSVGKSLKAAAKEPAAQMWFEPFNSTLTIVEWRMAGKKPFAIIQRWLIADNADRDAKDRPRDKAMLAVTACRPAKCAMSPMSTSQPIRMRTNWRARPPTSWRAISNAARTR